MASRGIRTFCVYIFLDFLVYFADIFNGLLELGNGFTEIYLAIGLKIFFLLLFTVYKHSSTLHICNMFCRFL